MVAPEPIEARLHRGGDRRTRVPLGLPAGREPVGTGRPLPRHGLTASSERDALERAKARLDRLDLYPRPVRIGRVRVLVWPWLFRLPWFRRFDGYAAWGTVILRLPAAEAGDDLVTHELCHVWQMQHRPAETPDGQPLGVALFVTEFPDLPPDFDAQVEHDGLDDSLYPSRARTVEMAHFADAAQARQFETEFRSYLVPGLIDGPELAPEVAKLEGLSGQWQDLTEREVIESMEPNRAVVRDPAHDTIAWREYLEAVARERPGWAEFYDACRELT